MPTFDWAESPGTSLELQPRVVATQFGDGYEQSADDGLNPVRQVWNVVINGADAAKAMEIQNFIAPGMGRARFDWTPPGATAPLRFKCTQFTRTLGNEVREVNLQMRFEQVFEP